jgi:EAL domain-containing protein (putative c-di-GMP-specific phosphodiesterase class I)
MAHIFDFNVIALGVETKEQLEYVQEVGCDYVQGFYFSEALKSDQILPYYNQYKQRDVVC